MKNKFNQMKVVSKKEYDELMKLYRVFNRIKMYIDIIQSEPNKKTDTLFILKNIIK